MQLKNGFYAFGGALHVFPISSRDCISLEEWNSESLWRSGYRDLAADLLFFAEDAFQDRFCLSPQGVVRFESETGNRVLGALTIDGWAKAIRGNYARETGYALWDSWQAANGPIPEDKRLMPRTPFFLGGSYSLDNLRAGDSVEGMRFKADMAVQTRDLPDGSQVRMIVGKKPQVQ